MNIGYRYSMGTPDGKNHSENLELDGRIILKWTSKE
jgi:hypothetical protein